METWYLGPYTEMGLSWVPRPSAEWGKADEDTHLFIHLFNGNLC